MRGLDGESNDKIKVPSSWAVLAWTVAHPATPLHRQYEAAQALAKLVLEAVGIDTPESESETERD